MIKFGPSGNDEKFFEEGLSKTIDAIPWIKNLGLDIYEYSFGHGLTLSSDTAKQIGDVAKNNNIEVSVHAPYYINFANPDNEAMEKSIGYVIKSLERLKDLGGRKCVVHSGSCLKQTREDALKNVYRGYENLLEKIYAENLSNLIVCPETMGKYAQIGTYKEIIDLCTIDKVLIPTFDFGHINCIEQGGLKTEDDFRKIIDYSLLKLGDYKTKNIHIHFSKIEYSDKGEIKHLDLSDEKYGPNFEPLAKVIKEYNLTPTVICESKNKMAYDALKLKNIYNNLK